MLSFTNHIIPVVYKFYHVLPIYKECNEKTILTVCILTRLFQAEIILL